MTEAVGSRMVTRARDLRARGRELVAELPTPSELSATPAEERHEILEGLRIELYAICSLIAEATVARAYRDRDEHPPYGLVRSGHTQFRMLLANPETVPAGAIGSFYELGLAYVDTMVFHLDRQLKQMLVSEHGWMLPRLDELLALYRIDAGPQAKARMRDRLSFMYGGLHFGTGVSVQMAEVMARLLEPYPDLTPDDKVRIMTRSSRPALRLAAFNIDHVIHVYEDLLEPVKPAAALGGPATARWFDPARFAVEERDGRPRRIDFRNEPGLGGRPRGRQLLDIPTAYDTHGCPARVSPSGGSPPITTLWTWCVQLADQLGLLGEAKPGDDEGP